MENPQQPDQRQGVNGGRGRGRGRGRKGNRKGGRPKSLSHSLSWALRHAAVELKLTMTPDGYVPVDEIIHHTHPKFRDATLEKIREVVDTNDKKRFKLEERPAKLYKTKDQDGADTNTDTSTSGDDELILCIRANQGHTVSIIDPNLLLTKMTADELRSTSTIVHGTYRQPYDSAIQKHGLSRMKRNHIHFASGLPDEGSVISGMRKSCQIYVYIDGAKCADDGIEFYKSDNGVILTAGVNNEGMLPTPYFSHVTDKTGTILLDNR
mmetsp:Transcript_5135/g.13803  ORF Transcript_5135/g.13803 Transcript_5135/m.13803 type:complete len:266 (-) Transcript_5135:931-1728(-)